MPRSHWPWSVSTSWPSRAATGTSAPTDSKRSVTSHHTSKARWNCISECAGDTKSERRSPLFEGGDQFGKELARSARHLLPGCEHQEVAVPAGNTPLLVVVLV